MRRFSKGCKIIHHHLNYTIGCLLAIAAVAILWMPAAPALATSAGQRQIRSNIEEGQQPVLSKANISIEKKSLQYLYAFGQRFAVNAETVIVGTDGKEITIKKMLVPCDAEVFFDIENGVRTAKRVNVKRVASGASWQWISEKPQ